MINPSLFPQLNPDVLETAGAAMSRWGKRIEADMTVLDTAWGGLRNCYHAPEEQQVYDLQKPAVKAAQQVHSDFSDAQKALKEYAEALRRIQPELAKLVTDANAFRQQVANRSSEQVSATGMNYGVDQEKLTPWDQDHNLRAQNDALVAELGRINAEISVAETTCANAIIAIIEKDTNSCLPGYAPVPAGAFIAGDPRLPAWGSIGQYKPDSCGDGLLYKYDQVAWDWGSYVGLSIGTQGPQFSGSVAKNAWAGQVDFLGSTLAAPIWITEALAVDLGAKDSYSSWSEARARASLGGIAGIVDLDFNAFLDTLAAGGSLKSALAAGGSEYLSNPSGALFGTLLNILMLKGMKSAHDAFTGAAKDSLLARSRAVGTDTTLGRAFWFGADVFARGGLTAWGVDQALRVLRPGGDFRAAMRTGSLEPGRKTALRPDFMKTFRMGPDGNLRAPGDALAHYRDKMGRLREPTGRWVEGQDEVYNAFKDAHPNAGVSIDHWASFSDSRRALTVLSYDEVLADPHATGALRDWATHAKLWDDLANQKLPLVRERDSVLKDLGLVSRDDKPLTTAVDTRKHLAQTMKDLQDQHVGTAGQRAKLMDLASQWLDLDERQHDASRAAGQAATSIHLDELSRFGIQQVPGAALDSGAGTVDNAGFKIVGNVLHVYLEEGKGGYAGGSDSSVLGDRWTRWGRAQQGTSAYAGQMLLDDETLNSFIKKQLAHNPTLGIEVHYSLDRSVDGKLVTRPFTIEQWNWKEILND